MKFILSDEEDIVRKSFNKFLYPYVYFFLAGIFSFYLSGESCFSNLILCDQLSEFVSKYIPYKHALSRKYEYYNSLFFYMAICWVLYIFSALHIFLSKYYVSKKGVLYSKKNLYDKKNIFLMLGAFLFGALMFAGVFYGDLFSIMEYQFGRAWIWQKLMFQSRFGMLVIGSLYFYMSLVLILFPIWIHWCCISFKNISEDDL